MSNTLNNYRSIECDGLRDPSVRKSLTNILGYVYYWRRHKMFFLTEKRTKYFVTFLTKICSSKNQEKKSDWTQLVLLDLHIRFKYLSIVRCSFQQALRIPENYRPPVQSTMTGLIKCNQINISGNTEPCHNGNTHTGFDLVLRPTGWEFSSSG